MADDNSTPPATGEKTDTPPNPAPSEPTGLGEAGKKALDQERQARREAEAKLKELAPLAAKARQLEDEQKSEAEKLAEKITAAEQRAQAAEEQMLRLQVAATKGLTPAQARRLVGTSREELEADADELLASFTSSAPPTRPRTPVEQLRPGALPSGAEPSLGDQIAAAE
ncbi:hypothetical protein, partial [Streptomyces sp. N35]|uniref:hypothetical protein n=1 Tax=Streptomyces sp. N35 TaxID=2795730 RepID=UPI0018F6DA9C